MRNSRLLALLPAVGLLFALLGVLHREEPAVPSAFAVVPAVVAAEAHDQESADLSVAGRFSRIPVDLTRVSRRVGALVGGAVRIPVVVVLAFGLALACWRAKRTLASARRVAEWLRAHRSPVALQTLLH
ncbi:hypothetical protein ALI22I_43530 [Saccharothrix sp. ALI-22-I]|uniref:hypothetical protein n=1 Tax=Saccharothrix sp. ALI-22-I TaxID=1933778 RepID=UPI00097CA95E|nr:hypothetical protein [Saccharothrix sp. ALI-22-I]ONI80248.1 hypothetical protein ALI22I_43530 [Saccharothrix sp. ALI-22-I]